MKKLLTGLVLLGLGNVSMADTGDIYVDVLGGVNILDNPTVFQNNVKRNWDSTHTGKGASFHLGAGYYLNDNIRLGTRYSYRRNNSTTVEEGDNVKHKRRSHTLMAEVAYDFVNSSSFTPYVKAGIGVARNSYGVDVLSQTIVFKKRNTTNFAWGLGVGVNYDISENLSLTAEYQYSDLGNSKTNNLTSDDGKYTFYNESDNHISEINIGLRYNF